MKMTLLSNAQRDAINERSLRILAETGVVVPHAETLDRFAEAGAAVDRETERVRIPADVVRSLVAKAGKQYTLTGRDPSKTAAFGQGRRNYNAIAGEASWVEEQGGNRRFATMADVATAARFGDALSALTIPGAMADPHDVPVNWRCVEVMATMLRNTTKPFTFWFHDRASAAFLVEMMIALRGSEEAAAANPLTYPFLEPISPLRFPRDGIDLLYETSRINMPVPVGPMAQMGLSAPATVAGTMAVENAEVLAGICITQLVKPGMPVCYGGICHAFDMRTTQMIFAGPEQALFGVGMTEIGKSYGLPVYINVGLTDSKLPDGQAGMEAMGTLLPGAAAGADIFGHMGICGVDQATSLDILLLQHEVIRYVESTLRDIATDDDAIPLDLINEAGPGGTYIDQMHTAEHFRQSLFMPELLDRDYFPTWYDKGRTSMADRIKTMKDRILKEHQPEPLDKDLDKEITRIVNAAKKQLGG